VRGESDRDDQPKNDREFALRLDATANSSVSDRVAPAQVSLVSPPQDAALVLTTAFDGERTQGWVVCQGCGEGAYLLAILV